MFQKLFFSSLIAGLLSGIIIASLYQVTTVPIIIEAEKYEQQSTEKSTQQSFNGAPVILAHGGDTHAGEEEGWMPEDGMERTLWTTITTILTAIGFAFLLTSGYALSNQTITARRGVVWGIAGFAALTLAPAVGLPPELPGSEAAALNERQIWWLMTAIFTSAGIALMVFTEKWLWCILGLVLILLPHITGAPHPAQFASPIPAEIGGHFAATSLATSFVLWVMLGWLTGKLYNHFDSQTA